MAEFLIVDKGCQLFESSSGCKLHRDPSSNKCKFLPLGRWRGTLQQEDIPLRYMKISKSLDMVGVELKASWIQTRKVNGEICPSKVSRTINAWKSGKFMNLTDRPWSLISFAMSKVWFRRYGLPIPRPIQFIGISIGKCIGIGSTLPFIQFVFPVHPSIPLLHSWLLTLLSRHLIYQIIGGVNHIRYQLSQQES